MELLTGARAHKLHSDYHFAISDDESKEENDAGMPVYLGVHAVQTKEYQISGELLFLRLKMVIQMKNIFLR